MSKDTKIAWCDSTVNPTMGCDGCELWSKLKQSCYAGKLHERFGGATKGYSPTFDEITFWRGRMLAATKFSDLTDEKRLAKEKRPAKPWLDGLPRLIFVSDMSDSLSKDVPFSFLEEEIIQNVISEKGSCHQWLWLTKRPERMAKFSEMLKEKGVLWPQNLWAGTSITTQKTTSRIEPLLEVGDDKTIRFLSVEPQYEQIDLSDWLPNLQWVIQGGESGMGATPFDIDWAFDMIDQCQRFKVPYFLKQLGTHVIQSGNRVKFKQFHADDWSEWESHLRVRQFPKIDVGPSRGGGTSESLPSSKPIAPRPKPTSNPKGSEAARKAWVTRRRLKAEREALENKPTAADQQNSSMTKPVHANELSRKEARFKRELGELLDAISEIPDQLEPKDLQDTAGVVNLLKYIKVKAKFIRELASE